MASKSSSKRPSTPAKKSGTKSPVRSSARAPASKPTVRPAEKKPVSAKKAPAKKAPAPAASKKAPVAAVKKGSGKAAKAPAGKSQGRAKAVAAGPAPTALPAEGEVARKDRDYLEQVIAYAREHGGKIPSDVLNDYLPPEVAQPESVELIIEKLRKIEIEVIGEGELAGRQRPSWWARFLNWLGF